MSILNKLFSIEKNQQKSHTTVTIFGIKMKFKNNKFTPYHNYYLDAQYKYFLKRNETMQGKNLIFIGDSIFNMFNVESIFKAINYGISGESLSNFSKRIDFLNSFKNQNIVLGFGVNDIGDMEPDEIIDNYKKVINILSKNNNLCISEILPVNEEMYKNTCHAVKLNADIQQVNRAIHTYIHTYIHTRLATCQAVNI